MSVVQNTKKMDARKVFLIANGLLMIIMILVTVVPFLNTLAISFSTAKGSMEPGNKLIPDPFSISGYQILFERIAIWRPLWNNIMVTISGTLIHVAISAITGYALTVRDFPGKRFFILFLMITMMIPMQNVMIPVYLMFRRVHLINTLLSIVVYGLVSAYSVLLLKNFFESIPKSLSESAYIDGANELTVFFRIYLPLSTAGLSTVTLFQFVGKWNHFMEAVLFINDPKKYTLQVALKNLIIHSDITSTTDSISKNTQMAGVVISIIPLILIYPYLQRYFISGIMLGSVKE